VKTLAAAGAVTSALVLTFSALPAGQARDHAALALWAEGKAAFGVFVPNENPAAGREGQPAGSSLPPRYTKAGGERLGANPLYDFVFLNLEGRYDAEAISAISAGLRAARPNPRTTLIVRIPPIGAGGADLAKRRVKEALDRGADGVTIPHVRDVAEARLAIGFFRDAGASVWSPSHPGGGTIAMLMIEDPGALAVAKEIAALPGYSILACGIGSLTRALGGNREAAEAGTREILGETKRAKLVNMLTASARDVEQRVSQGFLALLFQGPSADEGIRIGRAAAGR
jgi:2-keto-3-deoxy-L-rhamnonate aldolase RhmA